MHPNLLDPNICPSSLGEDDEPTITGETAHRWDTTTDPATCAECGAEKMPDDPTCRECGKTRVRGTREATRDFVLHDICVGCTSKPSNV